MTEKKESDGLTKEMKDFISFIENLNVIELSKLVKVLEDKLGVTVSNMTTPINNDNSSIKIDKSKEEEKTSFNVILKSFGNTKIPVIKEIRTITGLGLADSKILVESAPKIVKENISKDESEKIKKTLEAVGAVIEVE